jgi:hypothetical protein
MALALVASMATGVAGLFGVAARATRAARDGTWTVALATQKLEELRGLTWSFDVATGARISDTTTDLSHDPPTGGGSGLAASPPAALLANTAGYVDFLDANGRWVGTGATPPAAAVYVRRWRIQPLAADPDDAVVLQVFVGTVTDRAQVAQAGANPAARLSGDTLLTTVRMRAVR